MKSHKLCQVLTITVLFIAMNFLSSCSTGGNPSEEGYTSISGTLSGTAGGELLRSEPSASSAARVPLVNHKLYCVTVHEPIVEGSGVADASGNVTAILQVKSGKIACSVHDPQGNRIAELIFSDSSGSTHGKTISARGAINLGIIEVNQSTGEANATVPFYVPIVPVALPETAITSGPENPTTSQTATFQFSCVQASCTYECDLDSSGWSSCSFPKIYNNLSPASHSFQVRAKNSAGYIDPTPAIYTWTIQEVFKRQWLQVAAGSAYSCAIAYDHSLWCWGSNCNGQLGDGTTADKNIPTQVGSGTDWGLVTGYGWHACAVKTNGTLWCWGLNSNGQLGDGTTADKNIPTQVGAGTDWELVTGGGWHTCAVKTNGTLWCWGLNSNGQLGDGTTVSKLIPTQVGVWADWERVTGGYDHACAVKTSGALWCWGANGVGQLGDGTTADKNIPTRVGSGTDWELVTDYGWHTCAVKTSGTLWCWGLNRNGQLGDGTTTDKKIPSQVGSGTDWELVIGGYAHTCAVKTNGSLWCWGRNVEGQLGDGTTAEKNISTQVGSGTDWGLLTGGEIHTCAVKTNGSLWCWGYNAWGQLGDGTNVNRNYPVEVL